MNNICDNYIKEKFNRNYLKFLELWDINFSYQENVLYTGYLGVCIHRIKLIPIIKMIRDEKISVWNVPIEYRDMPHISKNKAIDIAMEYIKNNNLIIPDNLECAIFDPLRWIFSTSDGERVGGSISVDKLDGHIWTLDESDIYAYDYNNMF